MTMPRSTRYHPNFDRTPSLGEILADAIKQQAARKQQDAYELLFDEATDALMNAQLKAQGSMFADEPLDEEPDSIPCGEPGCCGFNPKRMAEDTDNEPGESFLDLVSAKRKKDKPMFANVEVPDLTKPAIQPKRTLDMSGLQYAVVSDGGLVLMVHQFLDRAEEYRDTYAKGCEILDMKTGEIC